MTFSDTTILCVAAGCGRTFFAEGNTVSTRTWFLGQRKITIPNSSFVIDLDLAEGDNVAEFAKKVRELAQSKSYRYILLPNDIKLRNALSMQGADYFVVCPENTDEELNHRIKLWLKSGASFKTIEGRVISWDANNHSINGEPPMIRLNFDEFVGNLFEQSPQREADRKDV